MTRNGIRCIVGMVQVKYLMEQLQRICDELRDENEIAIIKEYGSNAKLYTAVLTCKRLRHAVSVRNIHSGILLFETNELPINIIGINIRYFTTTDSDLQNNFSSTILQVPAPAAYSLFFPCLFGRGYSVSFCLRMSRGCIARRKL